MKNLKQLAAVLAVAVLAGNAAAAQITDAADIPALQKVITFDAYDGFITSGPENVGTAIGADVWFSSGPNAVLGAYVQDLGTNGAWADLPGSTTTVDNRFVASAFVGTRGELGFSFAQPVAAVGAFFNNYQVAGVTNSIRLLAYDQYGNDLESFSYSIDTDALGYNEGQFLGFKRGTADIYGFGVAGGTFVVDNLTLSAPVPEPETYLLLLAGLLAIGWVVRRRQD